MQYVAPPKGAPALLPLSPAMPEHSVADAAAKISDLIRQAILLSDKAEMSLVSIHLDEALQALPTAVHGQE